MTPEVMSHIFDPLYTTKDRGRGTGLGLVIVKQVVTELGGTVTVESELGEGTHFRIDFPAIPSDVPVAVEEQERSAEAHDGVEVGVQPGPPQLAGESHHGGRGAGGREAEVR